MEEKKFHNSKLLRYGYTTGSCAAAAAKAAAQMLRTGQPVSQVRIVTPSGVPLTLDVLDPVLGEDSASCAIRKDGGDDPDATSGLLIYATVRPIPQGIRVDGGPGVGRVTKPGLDQPVGAAAINHVPRQMIEAAVAEALQGASGGMEVIISVPGGEEVGKRTFNPHPGIQAALIRHDPIGRQLLAPCGEEYIAGDGIQKPGCLLRGGHLHHPLPALIPAQQTHQG